MGDPGLDGSGGEGTGEIRGEFCKHHWISLE